MDGNILLKARKILGINQYEMADKLGISYQTYNGYENGRTIPKTKYGRINEVINEAENKKNNVDSALNIESTDILNDLLKEVKAWRRENREIKNLLNEVIIQNSETIKINQLSSSQFDILKQVMQNLSTQIEENRKADLKKSASGK